MGEKMNKGGEFLVITIFINFHLIFVENKDHFFLRIFLFFDACIGRMDRIKRSSESTEDVKLFNDTIRWRFLFLICFLNGSAA